MAYRTGAYSRVVVGTETSFGSGQTTPVGYELPKASISVGWSEDVGATDELRSDPNPAPPIRGLQRIAGQIVQVCDLDSPGVMLRRFFTTVSQSGTAAPFTNVFKVSAVAPSSIWVEVGDTSASKYDRYYGCKVVGFSLSVTKRAETFKVTWDIIGAGNPATLNQATPYDATVETYAGARTSLVDAQVKINGTLSTLLLGFDATVRRASEPQYVLDGNRYAASITDGAYSVSGRLTALWDDADTIRSYCTSDAEKYLELIIQKPGDATRYMNFKFEEVKLFLSSPPSIGSPGNAPITVDFIGYYQDAAAGSAISVTLVNDTQTYPA
ncbi:MAG TPA: phage tail tube protein [Propionibacteriaceae bacterium]|nr:phage tail tube protein [Propionibacteriaceae bacterium]